jgi:glyoxylase-like metal-dependent hydrolase (beta-lactamase superfamily II)
MKLFPIVAGHFIADGGACFGVVPKKAWQKRYPCDEHNFCKLVMRCLLVDTGERRILIDTGTGTKQPDYLKYYGVRDIIDFENELNCRGYHTGDITDVVHTHLHFDHCGGSTYKDENRNLQLTFPNAMYWVGEAQWRNSLNPNVREDDSYFPENMQKVYEDGKLILVAENLSLCPEVELRLFHGHTPGQIAVYIHAPGQTYLYPGDVIPMAANIPLAWVSAYDTYPVISMTEKKVMLDEAAEQKQILIFIHDAYTEACTVKRENGKYKIAALHTI